MKYEWPDDRLMRWKQYNVAEYVPSTTIEWCRSHRSVLSDEDYGPSKRFCWYALFVWEANYGAPVDRCEFVKARLIE